MNHILFQMYGIEITGWKILGYIGVCIFVSRWIVQLYASRKAGRPVMTRWFWILSLVGSFSVLIYFIFGSHDSVGVLCNFFPSFIALYNLFLDIRYQRKLNHKCLSNLQSERF